MTQLAGSMANDEVVNVELLGSIELKSLSEVVFEDKLRKLAAAASGKACSVEAWDLKSFSI